MKVYIQGSGYANYDVFDQDPNVRANIAKATDDIELLEIYSQDPEEYVRAAVAGNKYTPIEVYQNLSIDPSFYVRSELACNRAVPPAILQSMYDDIIGVQYNLADDAIYGGGDAPEYLWWLIGNIAANPNTPERVLRDFATAAHWGPRTKVASNPSTPADVLDYLSNTDIDEDVLSNITVNPSAPEYVIKQAEDRLSQLFGHRFS